MPNSSIPLRDPVGRPSDADQRDPCSGAGEGEPDWGAAADRALRGIEKPLAFALRGGSRNLGRIRGLEESVAQAVARAEAALRLTGAQRDALMAVAAMLPAPDTPQTLRVQALQRCMSAVAALRRGWLDQGDGHVAAQGASPASSASPASATSVTSPASALQPASLVSPACPDGADAPVQYLKGVGPKVAALLGRRHIQTFADLLRFLPTRYERRQSVGRIADVEAGAAAVVEGTVAAVQSRRMGGRWNLQVNVADGTGVLTLMWFKIPGKGFAARFARGMRLRVAGRVTRFRDRLQMVHPETTPVRAASCGTTPSAAALSNAGRSSAGPSTSGPSTSGPCTSGPSMAAPSFATPSAVLPPGSTDAGAPPGPSDAVIPIYGEVEGLRPSHLRRLLRSALPVAHSLPDILPPSLYSSRRLPSLCEALTALHAPPPDAVVADWDARATCWHRRLIYEELLLMQLAIVRRKVEAKALAAPQALRLSDPLADLADRLLPFAPTAAQQRALNEIEADLRGPTPMHRLLQGDVGSGKTAVALMSAAAVAEAGLQVAIMAPTELLAEQHLRSALKILHPAGIEVALLTGGLGSAEKKRVLADIASGRTQVVVGTHAIIQSGVTFASLGLAVVDEQHRFGVLQRARIVAMGNAPATEDPAKVGRSVAPHVLVMTATPIPRTLAMTLYGDLDVTVIDALPPGRSPVRTLVYRDAERGQVYQRVRHAAQAGRQAYVVFPLVEESDKEGMEHLYDATSSAEALVAGPLQGLRIGLLHGRLSADEKDRIMRSFAAGTLQVLVATTVIEVGIDVPNATTIVIEHAERFGLSQLHQLRGRVGRGTHQSECLLVAHRRPTEEASRRLTAMERTNDGFQIAEEDLAIRGPGDFIGTRQSGLPTLSVADLMRDQDLLTWAREDAAALLAADPKLIRSEHALLGRALAPWLERAALAEVG